MNGAPYRYISACNLLSYVSLACGVCAIFAAREFASWEASGLFIALAALADTFDGRFARRFKRTDFAASFGVQLDSLVDVVSFGVAPVAALTALVRVNHGAMQLLWIAVMSFYILCAITRLGFYNLHHAGTAGFIGLPTTLAAVIWATLFLMHPPPFVVLASMVCIGAAMISPLHVPRPRGSTMVAYLLWLGAVLLCNGAVLSQGFQK